MKSYSSTELIVNTNQSSSEDLPRKPAQPNRATNVSLSKSNRALYSTWDARHEALQYLQAATSREQPD